MPQKNSGRNDNRELYSVLFRGPNLNAIDGPNHAKGTGRRSVRQGRICCRARLFQALDQPLFNQRTDRRFKRRGGFGNVLLSMSAG